MKEYKLKQKGYKVVFKDGTETKPYTSKRFCEFMMKLTGDHGDIVETDFQFYGNAVMQEASYKLAQLAETCIECQNIKITSFSHPSCIQTLFVLKNKFGAAIKEGYDRSDLIKNSYKYRMEFCKICRITEEKQIASNACCIGYAKQAEIKS